MYNLKERVYSFLLKLFEFYRNNWGKFLVFGGVVNDEGVVCMVFEECICYF